MTIRYHPHGYVSAAALARKARKAAARAARDEGGYPKGLIHDAQGGRCYLCDTRFRRGILPPTRDHVTPRARGGQCAANVLVACRPCNLTKGDRAPHPCELIYLAAVNARVEAYLAASG